MIRWISKRQSFDKMLSPDQHREIQATVRQLRSLMNIQGIPCCQLKRGHPQRITSLRKCVRHLRAAGLEYDPLMKALCLAEPFMMGAILRKFRPCKKSSKVPTTSSAPAPSPSDPVPDLVPFSLSPLMCVGLRDLCDVSEVDRPLETPSEDTSSNSNQTSSFCDNILRDANFAACAEELDKWFRSVRPDL